MEIHGERVLLTCSEAVWMQGIGISFHKLPELAQKILDARIIFASQYLSPDDLPTISTAEAATNISARIRLDNQTRKIAKSRQNVAPIRMVLSAIS